MSLTGFLVFNVEEGLTNQRIGIVSGLLIASLMGRTVSRQAGEEGGDIHERMICLTIWQSSGIRRLLAGLWCGQAVFPNLKTSYLPEATHEVPFDAM